MVEKTFEELFPGLAPGKPTWDTRERSPEELRMRDDFEWAMGDPAIQTQYAGKVIIVMNRQVYGVGVSSSEALIQALRRHDYPREAELGGVAVPICGVPLTDKFESIFNGLEPTKDMPR